MKDYIAKQAYDKGYYAGTRAAHEAEYIAVNPYKKTHGWTTSRYDYWQMGVRDGWHGSPRKISQEEAEDRAHKRLAALEAVYKAAEALHLAEDFEEVPCQHACCAPQDWGTYQATRKALYDALVTAREAVTHA